jgi:hypothetical protein
MKSFGALTIRGKRAHVPLKVHIMSSASRPGHRSSRRSRRRQAILVCCGLSYLAAVVAGILALLSLFAGLGGGAVYALVVCAGFMVIAVALLGRERVEARRRDEPPLPAHLA